MEYLGQRNWHCLVTRPQKDLVHARTTYLTIDTEAMASLKVDAATLEIKEARWDIHRREKGRPECLSVPALAGQRAYFGSGPVMRKALAGFHPAAAGLFAETIRGVIQAETWLIRERSYASMEDYDRVWTQEHRGSCRYYSNLDRVTGTWSEHIADQERTDVLFNRFKSAVWHRLPEGDLLITATLADSFHNVGLTVQAALPSFTVVEARGKVRRAPDAVCREAGATVPDLAGTALTQTDKRTVAQILGGPQACVHLVDLAGDVCRELALDLARKTGDS
ncbi:MAG: DUF2889 domain-containing protein [Peptococcaceae bacterium]|jgi:hypothetical protein|nr:DUF2889 domain-containing protein [Peptococcaceae bacterium]